MWFFFCMWILCCEISYSFQHGQFSLLCQVTQNNRILSTFLGHLIKYPTTRPNLSFKQISYGRFSTKPRGKCELDLFIMQADGKKIVNPSKQKSLSSRLRMELLRPLRVTVVSRGPDTELLVANPVELSGKGRPLVFYDITLALKMLGPCIFSVLSDHYVTSYCLFSHLIFQWSYSPLGD